MIDNHSINGIWEEFSSVLRGFIFGQVRDETVTDDILQEVFVKIINNIDKLKDKTKLRAWLYQITRNNIIDHYRHHKTKALIPEYTGDIASEEEIDAQLSEELGPCIKALMERLSDKYKAAIELRMNEETTTNTADTNGNNDACDCMAMMQNFQKMFANLSQGKGFSDCCAMMKQMCAVTPEKSGG